jgi:hypothetical protein
LASAASQELRAALSGPGGWRPSHDVVVETNNQARMFAVISLAVGRPVTPIRVRVHVPVQVNHPGAAMDDETR